MNARAIVALGAALAAGGPVDLAAEPVPAKTATASAVDAGMSVATESPRPPRMDAGAGPDDGGVGRGPASMDPAGTSTPSGLSPGAAPDDAGVAPRRAGRPSTARPRRKTAPARPSRRVTDAGVGALDAGRPAVEVPSRRRGRSRRRFRRARPDAGVVSRAPEPKPAVDAGVTAPDAGIVTVPIEVPGPLVSEPAAPGWAQRFWERLGRAVSVFVPVAQLRASTDPLLLVLLIALGLLVSAGAARLRPRLAPRGALPALLGFLHAAGRFVALILTVILLARAAPAWLQPALPWVLLAAAAAVGWSARDVLPDILAGAVLVAERRVRRGVWLRGSGFSGAVERLGMRATWLRDELGRQVAVPNRQLLSQPVVMAEDGAVTHETRLRFTGARTVELRRALTQAVVTSPWVPVGSPVQLRQDGDDPTLWHVQVRLRRRADGPRFDGELIARAQAMLAGQANLL